MFSTKPDKYMRDSCIGWESPTSDFKWRFQKIAGLVDKEVVFEKHKQNSFWNGLNFKKGRIYFGERETFSKFLIRKHQNNSFAIL